MDRTPKILKSSKRRNLSKGTGNFLIGTANEFQSCTAVPVTSMCTEAENYDSPLQMPCTQEAIESVDVVWDWNSPQAKQRQKKAQKRLVSSQSPTVPLKKHPSHNNIQNFEKLREELESLRSAIAVPDHEESLILSPVEEAEYKYVNNDQQEICFEMKCEDLFNDSDDEALLQCTQNLEAKIEAAEKNGYNNNVINNLTGHDTQSTRMDKVTINATVKKFKFRLSKSPNRIEPLENLFKNRIENFEADTDVYNKTNHDHSIKNAMQAGITRTRSENLCLNSNQMSKVEFHRTQSFESTVEYTKGVLPRHKLEEIERKRKEALAKLQSKRKKEYSNSPVKCSPEEIEQKRLQALAKLEAKRLQEFIERKRQEALKRLELSRKKNATVVKSFLSKRL